MSVQEGPKKRTMIILVSSSLESAGVARMPGLTCMVRSGNCGMIKDNECAFEACHEHRNKSKYALEDNLLFMSTPSSNVSRFSINRLFPALNLLGHLRREKRQNREERREGGERSFRVPSPPLLFSFALF